MRYHPRLSIHPTQSTETVISWYELYPEIYGRVYFGHWAVLAGITSVDHVISMDGGCVHGGKLIIENIDTRKRYMVNRIY